MAEERTNNQNPAAHYYIKISHLESHDGKVGGREDFPKELNGLKSEGQCGYYQGTIHGKERLGEVLDEILDLNLTGLGIECLSKEIIK